VRVFFGPYNIAGSGRLLADALRASGHVADFVVWIDRTPHQNAHYDLHLERVSGWRWLSAGLFFLSLLPRYDVFHFTGGVSFFPFGVDLPILRLLGKKLVMQYNGSDIRLRAVEDRRNPYIGLQDSPANEADRDRGKLRRMRWHRRWVHKAFAVRNGYDHARQVYPEAKLLTAPWVNNPLDLRQYPPGPPPDRFPPLVVHAPTNPTIKGSTFIEAAVEQLQRVGVPLRYRRLEGMPHGEVQRIIREEADIVVDQLLFGGVGSFAFEAMAAQRPVVVNMIPEVQQRHYPDCPAVNATVESIVERLEHLVVHPEERVRLGRAGRAFVERHCDADRMAAELLDIYAGL